MPAFERAVALGYRYLETDVHVTADGVLLAFHDAVLDRVTDQMGPPATLTSEEIGQLPSHPSGPIELREDDLKGIAAAALTTALKCTEFSYNNFRRCCP